MRTLLWLDDIRNPYLNLEGKVPEGCDKIIWARSYEEFTELIELFGLPDLVSFDHDLGDVLDKEDFEWVEKTGYDCAKWLVDYCADREHTLPRCYIHSGNTVGVDNIKSYLNNFIKHSAASRLH